MRPALLASLAVVLSLAPPLHAQGEALAGTLAYVLGPGAEACPGEEMLRAEVARRVGYDPFASGAAGVPFGRVRVVVEHAPPGLVATYAYDDPAGVRRWAKTYAVAGAGRDR